MLSFKEDEYKTSEKLIIEARPIAEQVASEINQQGYSNIFFASVGGSLAPMMVIGEIAKEVTDAPIYIEQAAELLIKGNKRLNKDSIVITLSKSGDTKESVAIAKWCREQGIRVVAITKKSDSNLAQAANWHIPMRHENGVEFEYMLLFWLFFKLLHLRGDFADYEQFGQQLEYLPQNLLAAKKQFDPKADEIAKKYYQSNYMIWVGGAEMWGEVYLFSMCILEEMQWLKTKAVSASEFFHGTLELVDKEQPLFLVKGEGKARVLDDRVERFAQKVTNNLVVIDTKDFPLHQIDDKFRWILAPTISSTLLVDRLAAHFESYTGHSLDIRRYYRQFDY